MPFEDFDRTHSNSRRIYESAREFTLEGVQWPGQYMSPYPIYMVGGEGARIYDVDGNSYIDYCMGHGPLIAGHRHPKVMEKVREQLAESQLVSPSCEHAVMLAEKVHRLVPSAEVVDFVGSGSDACAITVKLARNYTGRELVAKFDGAYHGVWDYFLAGMPHYKNAARATIKEMANKTLVLPWNDIAALGEMFAKRGEEIACVILEPILRVIPPLPGFLAEVRSLCHKYGALLVFDEVVTGFRLGLGGGQGYFGVIPDLTALGKGVGGGFPIGAVAGKRDIMQMLSPTYQGETPIHWNSTWAGHPVSMVAGLATLDILEEKGQYGRLFSMGDIFRQAFTEVLQSLDLKMQVVGVGPINKVLFTDEKVVDLKSAQPKYYYRELGTLKRTMLQLGLHMQGGLTSPVPGIGKYISVVHTEDIIQESAAIFKKALLETDLRHAEPQPQVGPSP